MKKIKVSILALSVLVGGAVFASAAKNSALVASTADITITNVAPLVWIETMNALPQSPFINTTNVSDASILIVDNDSKGKIFGVVNVIQDFTQGTNNSIFAESSWIGNVSGSLKASKMGQPTVQMTIKANGYSSPTTNTFVIAKQSSSAGNASVNINFKSTSAAVPNNTNIVSGFNAAKVAGTSKISFKPGITGIQEKKNVTETATLDVWLVSEKNLGMRVVSFGSKFGVIMQDLFGTGSLNSKNQFTVNLKSGGGDSLQLKGQVAAAAIIQGGATNQIVTISQVDEKGKVSGQAVEGKGFFSSFGD